MSVSLAQSYQTRCAEAGCHANRAFLARLAARDAGAPITILDMSSNILGGSGFVAVAQVLSKIPELEGLNLSGNKLDNEHIYFLSGSLLKNTRLTVLDLSNNPISSWGGKHIRALVARLPSLTRVDLSRCPINRAIVKEIDSMLEQRMYGTVPVQPSTVVVETPPTAKKAFTEETTMPRTDARPATVQPAVASSQPLPRGSRLAPEESASASVRTVPNKRRLSNGVESLFSLQKLASAASDPLSKSLFSLSKLISAVTSSRVLTLSTTSSTSLYDSPKALAPAAADASHSHNRRLTADESMTEKLPHLHTLLRSLIDNSTFATAVLPSNSPASRRITPNLYILFKAAV